MSQENLDKIFGVIGTAMVVVFVLGLAWSISAGAAGIWGGLPFWVICVSILVLVSRDLWDTCIKKKPTN